MLALKNLEDVNEGASQDGEEEDFDIEQYMNTNTNTTANGIYSVASQSKRNLYRGASDGETKYEYTLLAIPPVKFGGQFFGD